MCAGTQMQTQLQTHTCVQQWHISDLSTTQKGQWNMSWGDAARLIASGWTSSEAHPGLRQDQLASSHNMSWKMRQAWCFHKHPPCRQHTLRASFFQLFFFRYFSTFVRCPFKCDPLPSGVAPSSWQERIPTAWPSISRHTSAKKKIN